MIAAHQRYDEPENRCFRQAGKHVERLKKFPGPVQINRRIEAQLVDAYEIPAKNADDFKAIGFEPNDLITGVNGLSLLDASNGARLYGLMRDAQEITFDIERDSVPLTLTVSLQTGTQR